MQLEHRPSEQTFTDYAGGKLYYYDAASGALKRKSWIIFSLGIGKTMTIFSQVDLNIKSRMNRDALFRFFEKSAVKFP
jgi:hypothetical protein